MQINPGELNKTIKIVKDSDAVNANGFRTGDHDVIRTCKAKYSRTSQKRVTENDNAGTDIEEVLVRFLIRYTSTHIDTKMKVLYGDKYYDITDINDINEEHRYIELFCKAGEM